MKRGWAALLALVMAFSCSVPAQAVEDPNVDYAALEAQVEELYTQIDALYEQVDALIETLGDRYADYYELYGDMDDWDEATWELSGTWDDYQWEGYYKGEAAYWAEQPQTPPPNNDWRVESKRAMGMPFPEGMNVRINGVYLDVAPLAADGVSYLPADVLLTALGAEEAGMETVELEGTVCLPIRPMAEQAGYEVSWEGYYDLVSLDNWDLLAEEIDRDFTVYNTLIRASMNTIDPAKTYAGKGKATYSATLYGETGHDTISMGLDFSTLMAGDYSAMSMDCALSADLTDMEDVIGNFGGQALLDGAKILNGTTFQYRLDGERGGMYFKGNRLSVMNDYLPDDTWMGMEDVSFGEAYTQLMGQVRDLSMGRLLVMLCKDGWQPYQSLEAGRAAARFLLGDDLFTTSKSGTSTTYTCNMDMLKLITRAAQQGLFTREDVTELFGETGIPTVSYKLTAKVAGEKLQSFALKGKFSWAAVTLEMDVDSTPTSSNCYLAIKGRYIGKIEVDASSTIQTTTRAVPGAPEAFTSYEALMEEYYQSLYNQWV